MKKHLIDFLKFITFSASNDNRGASGKKIIAYFLIACIVGAHASWLKNAHEHNDYSLLMQVLWFDGIMIGSLYGLNITDKKLNTGDTENKNP